MTKIPATSSPNRCQHCKDHGLRWLRWSLALDAFVWACCGNRFRKETR